MNKTVKSFSVNKRGHFWLGVCLSIIVFGSTFALVLDTSGFPIFAFLGSFLFTAFYLCSALLVRQINVSDDEIVFKPIGLKFNPDNIISIEKVARHHGKAYGMVVKTNSDKAIWLPSTFMHGNGTGKFDLSGGDGEAFVAALEEIIAKRQ